MRLKVGLGLLVALLGVIALVVILHDPGGPRQFIATNYTLTGDDDDINDDDGLVYTSPKAPDVVVDEITKAWKPAQRRTDPAGHFLRYSDTFVAVTAGEGGQGSTIYVDEEARGYTRWYGYVGGYWGTNSSGGGFRGGGPGAGK